MADAGDIPRRVFEALLAADGCAPTEAMRAELRAIGFDPAEASEWYPVSVWRAALEVVRRHVLPELPVDAAHVELGRRFAAGFGRTTVGRVFRVVAPMLGPDRAMQAVPRYLHAVRRNLRVSMVAEGDGRYRLIGEDRVPAAHFVAGCLLGVLDLFSISGRARVVQEGEGLFEVEIEWDVQAARS